eukprot:3844273-Prymnesium_polylepis.1
MSQKCGFGTTIKVLAFGLCVRHKAVPGLYHITHVVAATRSLSHAKINQASRSSVVPLTTR